MEHSIKPSALLDVAGLTKSFGGVHAVRDCTFTVAEGTVVGLIGPNGAGKSTTIDLISGFKRPDSGTIRFAGQEVQGLPPHQISRLGLVRTFQTAREWPHLTVMENMLVAVRHKDREAVWRAVLTPRRVRQAEQQDRVTARALLNQFGLLRLKNEYASNLSGGQKRLLEFARIMFARPRMAVLDEPMAGVNPVLATGLCEAITTLASEGITVLMVEHNLPFVERVCPHTIVMAEGTHIAEGTMEELRRHRAVVDAYLGEVTV